MNTTVYKYIFGPLSCIDNNSVYSIPMPKDAEIIHVGADPNFPSLALWAVVDPSLAPTIIRRFIVRGTGHNIGFMLTRKHIGSVSNSSLMFHVFEVEISK